MIVVAITADTGERIGELAREGGLPVCQRCGHAHYPGGCFAEPES